MCAYTQAYPSGHCAAIVPSWVDYGRREMKGREGQGMKGEAKK
jgi:hypothetical protein